MSNPNHAQPCRCADCIDGENRLVRNTPGAADALTKTDDEWREFCRPYVFMNGSHEFPNYAAICKAVAALSAPASVAGAPSDKGNTIDVANRLITERADGTADKDLQAWAQEAAITLARFVDTVGVPSEAVRECGNEDCGWKGQTDRMMGSIGPLCPACGETTEAAPSAAAPSAATGAIDAREQEVKRLQVILDGDRQAIADALHGYKGAPQNAGDVQRIIERAALASQDEAPAPSAASAQKTAPTEAEIDILWKKQQITRSEMEEMRERLNCAAPTQQAVLTDAEIDAIAAPWLAPDGQANDSDVRQIVRAAMLKAASK